MPVRRHLRDANARSRGLNPAVVAYQTVIAASRGGPTSTAAATSSTPSATQSGSATITVDEISTLFPESLTRADIHDQVAQGMQNIAGTLQEYLLRRDAARENTDADRGGREHPNVFPPTLADAGNALIDDAEAHMAALHGAERQSANNATTADHGTYAARQARRNTARTHLQAEPARQRSPPRITDTVVLEEDAGAEGALVRNFSGDESDCSDQPETANRGQNRRPRADSPRSFAPEYHLVDSDLEGEAEGARGPDAIGQRRW